MKRPTPEQGVRLLRLLQQALDEDRLLPGYQPLLQVRFPTRKTFRLECDLQTGSGQTVPYITLERVSRNSQAGINLDRWLIQKGLEKLHELHLEQPDAWMVIPQSAAALANPEYPAWLERQQEIASVSSQGLILAFRLSQISRNLKPAHACFCALHRMEIRTMIEGFNAHPAALKVLKAMHSRYVSVSRSLQKGGEGMDGIIDHRLKSFHRMGVQILLPAIHRPEDVNLRWSAGVDLLAGDYIHPVRRDTDFSFPPVVT